MKGELIVIVSKSFMHFLSFLLACTADNSPLMQFCLIFIGIFARDSRYIRNSLPSTSSCCNIIHTVSLWCRQVDSDRPQVCFMRICNSPHYIPQPLCYSELQYTGHSPTVSIKADGNKGELLFSCAAPPGKFCAHGRLFGTLDIFQALDFL